MVCFAYLKSSPCVFHSKTLVSRRYHIYKNISWSKAQEGDKVIQMETKKESLNIDSYEIQKIEGKNDENSDIDISLMNTENHIIASDYTYK